MKTFALFVSALALACSALADITIYPNGIVNSTNTSSGCPSGTFIAHTTYAKTPGNGWGWIADTNSSSYTATYTNQTNVVIQYQGNALDSACGTNSVSIPKPTPSPKYRFTIWWRSGTTNVPTSTNDAPLVLHGFLP